MALATISTKGQVTIPKKIRDSLHLHKGDKIEIVLNNQGEAVIRPLSKKVDDLFGILKKNEQMVVSVEEMSEAVRNRMKHFKE